MSTQSTLELPRPRPGGPEEQSQLKHSHKSTEQPAAETYPRVLPANLPRVSEPERNHGESLVLPGLEVLPAPEVLFSLDLRKNKRWNHHQQHQTASKQTWSFRWNSWGLI